MVWEYMIFCQRRELEWLLKGDTLDRLLVDDTLPQSDFTLRRNRQQQQQPAAKEAPRRDSGDTTRRIGDTSVVRILAIIIGSWW